MDKNLTMRLAQFEKSEEGASDALIDSIQQLLDFELPADYVNVMKEFNGGEGEVGENSWLTIFPIEELILVNNDYKLLMEGVPNLFLFGKDAADSGYAFNKEKKSYHSFGLMSDFKTDSIIFCGNNFSEFIEFLYNY
jgi:hypothetical protein